MKTEIKVNNQVIEASSGNTILSVLNKNGIRIPTLCSISSLTPTGACRLCVVEVENRSNLVTACSQPVEEGMVIFTHSPRVLNARKTLLELLLANHPDDCLYCENNQHCELQELALELNVRERRFRGSKKEQHIDHSSQAIIKDTSKCILCGRCIRICEEIMNVSAIDYSGRGNKTKVDTCMSKGLNFSTCISCGQCVYSCPTGALREMSSLDQVVDALRNSELNVYLQLSEEILFHIADNLGMKPSQKVNGNIISAIKKCGFDKVFDSGFAGDIFIEESKNEFFEFNENKTTYILTHCPSVKTYIEQFYPALVKNTNHLKSSWQIMAGIIKNIYAKKNKINKENIYNVAVTTCTSTKAEASRPDMMTEGIPDLDAVISANEIIRLIKLSGIEINKDDKNEFDFPYNISSSASSLLNIPGGISEAVLRSNDTKESGLNQKRKELRGIKTERDITSKNGLKQLKVKIVNEIRNAIPYLNDIVNGKSEYDLLEISTCPESCMNHRGTSDFSTNNSYSGQCSKHIYKADDKAPIKNSSKNPLIKGFYDNFKNKNDLKRFFYYNTEK